MPLERALARALPPNHDAQVAARSPADWNPYVVARLPELNRDAPAPVSVMLLELNRGAPAVVQAPRCHR